MDTHEFDPDIVLVVRDPTVTTIHGTWTATAREINSVLEGKLEVEVKATIEITQILEKTLPGFDNPEIDSEAEQHDP